MSIPPQRCANCHEIIAVRIDRKAIKHAFQDRCDKLLFIRVRGGDPERFIKVPGRDNGTGLVCDWSVRVQTRALLGLTDAGSMPQLIVKEYRVEDSRGLYSRLSVHR